MRKLLITIVIVISMILLVACGRGGNSTPDSTPTLTPETTEDTTITNTDVTVPTDTEDTSTEDGMIVNDYNPVIIAIKDQDGTFRKGYVLGGSQNNKWYGTQDFTMDGEYILPEDFFGIPIEDNYVDLDLVKGNETYKFYSENGLLSQSKGKKPTLFISPDSGESILTVEIDPLNAADNYIIGINGKWNAAPDTPVLFTEGTTISIDLDGDGQEELVTLVSLGFKQDPHGNDIEELALNLVNNNNDILICKILVDGINTNDYKIFALDLNGNGTLEIIVVESGFDVTVRAFEIKEDIADLVLRFHMGTN